MHPFDAWYAKTLESYQQFLDRFPQPKFGLRQPIALVVIYILFK